MAQLQYTQWPTGVPTSLPVATHTLDDNLRNSARRYPDKTALVYYGGVTTYAELDAKATAVAAYLQSVCGIAKGVLISVEN